VKDYRNIDFEELDAQFNVAASVPDAAALRERYTTLSEQARKELEGEFNVRYGPTNAEVLDIFPAGKSNAPIHVFIHGGYWRRLSKDDFSFLAQPFVAAGCSVIAVDYARAPMVSIDEIVRQNRAALTWIYRHAKEFDSDPGNIHISGHSVGGQLVGMMLATAWEEEYGLPSDLIKSACGISGVYDLEPIRFTHVNAWAQLDMESAYRNSPIHHIPDTGCALILACGGQETKEFRRQTDAYATAWKAKGHPCQVIPMPAHNHFSIVEEVLNPDSPLTRAIITRMAP